PYGRQAGCPERCRPLPFHLVQRHEVCDSAGAVSVQWVFCQYPYGQIHLEVGSWELDRYFAEMRHRWGKTDFLVGGGYHISCNKEAFPRVLSSYMRCFPNSLPVNGKIK